MTCITFLRFYLVIHRHTERGRDTGRGRSRLHGRSLMWNLILGLWDHTLCQSQMLNRWATQVSLHQSILTVNLSRACLNMWYGHYLGLRNLWLPKCYPLGANHVLPLVPYILLLTLTIAKTYLYVHQIIPPSTGQIAVNFVMRSCHMTTTSQQSVLL